MTCPPLPALLSSSSLSEIGHCLLLNGKVLFYSLSPWELYKLRTPMQLQTLKTPFKNYQEEGKHVLEEITFCGQCSTQHFKG